jgi:hypothetical protein
MHKKTAKKQHGHDLSKLRGGKKIHSKIIGKFHARGGKG